MDGNNALPNKLFLQFNQGGELMANTPNMHIVCGSLDLDFDTVYFGGCRISPINTDTHFSMELTLVLAPDTLYQF